MDPKNPDFQAMMGSFMQNAQKMQENMKKAYQDITEKNKDKVVSGRAGGDLVTAYANLKMQIVRFEFNPALFEESPEVIGELITSATNQALFQAQETMKQEMMAITKNMGLPTDLPLPFGKKGE